MSDTHQATENIARPSISPLLAQEIIKLAKKHGATYVDLLHACACVSALCSSQIGATDNKPVAQENTR